MTGVKADEELYSRFQGNSAILDAGARRQAEAGDAVGALALAWGSDVYAGQATVWEQSLIIARYPLRHFFRLGEEIVTGSVETLSSSTVPASAAELISGVRKAILAAADPALRAPLAASWHDLGFLEGVPAPSAEELIESVRRRTGGVELDEFIAYRRRESDASMTVARAQLDDGHPAEAIQAAYASDLGILEAYLVESSIAVGDRCMLTTAVRWELVSAAISSLPALPGDPQEAIVAIRGAMAEALGEPEATRLSSQLLTF